MSKARQLADNGAATPNRNMVINGAMNVAQRSTSVTGIGASAGYFTCDRWGINAVSTAGRLTMTQTADGPVGFANCVKLDCTTADASIAAGEALILEQRIEGQNLQRIGKGETGAQQITVSFYVKASAAFTFGCELYDNDNVRQITKLFTTTTDWNRIELTFPADVDDGSSPFDDDNAVSLFLHFWLHAGATYTGGTLNTTAWANNNNANRAVGVGSFLSSTDNNFFITGVQMEVGPAATPFEHKTFAQDLADCQRYYYNHTGGISDAVVGTGISYDADSIFCVVDFPTTMRAAPSIVQVTGTNYYRFFHTDSSANFTGFDGLQEASTHRCTIFNNGEPTGMTTGNVGWIRAANSAAILSFDAEL